jgi:hypothetical protein
VLVELEVTRVRFLGAFSHCPGQRRDRHGGTCSGEARQDPDERLRKYGSAATASLSGMDAVR